MSYRTIALCAQDQSLVQRVNACVAQEGEWQNPYGWTGQHMWAISIANDIEDAYAYALSVDNPDPGGDEGVVTDGMILAKVQSLMNPPAMPTEP
jgi:hypothetical protein